MSTDALFQLGIVSGSRNAAQKEDFRSPKALLRATATFALLAAANRTVPPSARLSDLSKALAQRHY